MAQWQLGETVEAGRRYEAAVDWMDARAPTSDSLKRFRAKAAEPLGLNEKKESRPSSGHTQ
jgi:hypothetical protein